MRFARILTAGALAAATLLGPAAAAAPADTPSPSPSGEDGSTPTEAGTSFRTATPVEQGQKATANGSSGDYLYWVFPADAGDRPTVRASVTLPEPTARHGAADWRIDVYDGLRRRQPCMYGMQSRTAAADAAKVELSCTLRPVRALADPWSDDPLPGSYYIRLTVTAQPEQDQGLPVRAEVEAVSRQAGGAWAVDGSLAEPLVPGVSADERRKEEEAALDWSSGWWSDRWIWTGAGGLLAALAGIGGYVLTRGSGRPARVAPGA
ncbi:hypothetical protein [Streptomyces genisteinicus]|uniref:Secreted protein n=1 Tax=Streptomyces genisteinicus TaxID=2768068 RepID=A0A7H0HZY2_9ACTN|nr:hypothetical protein [Streptomyces genisteinicus]QNP66098.1 hypothetical protein IAG43_26345 [Streptomyces genisteinicus]